MKQNYEDKDLPGKLVPFIWRYLKHRKIFLVGFFFVAMVWATEMSLRPYLLKVIIDAVVKYSRNNTQMIIATLTPAILYVSLSIIVNLALRLHSYLNLRLFPEIKAAANKDMFEYLMHHSHAFFQNNFSGSLSKKIFDIANIEQLIGIINELFYPRIFAILISSITLFIVVKPIFGIILFLWAIFFVCFSYSAAKKLEKLAGLYSEAFAKAGGTISDSISNIMSTKLFANIPEEVAYVHKDIDYLVECDRAVDWKNLQISLIRGFSLTILIAAMIITLIYGRTQGWVSPGDFALVLMLSISLCSSMGDLGQSMLQFFRIVGTCNQALSFIRIAHEIVDAPDAVPLRVTKGEIKLQNVAFHYENSKPLFENLNITIHPGEKIGLVGYSGGGKSTFIKLILRLIDAQSGSILIDGQDIKKVTQDSIRKQIGTIPQEPDLFHRTIMENIRFAKPDASDADVIEAAKKAKCHEFISEMPDKYQSLVGERGIKLSGGQKQRIAVARAFLKNAPILLLDEATSSLDSITESSIQESLYEVMANKTTIVIAHRLSTLKNMDRILVFVNGKIAEDGSLDSLLKNNKSHFHKLWQMQAEGFIPLMAKQAS
ncbi:MAG: ABC transporter ATP-binding protein/permease [Gammaproteobacteria bacterium]|nr:ABC transporter ATP-binding protein/permease [Gammaproteobacteria bacterium]